MNDNFYYSDNNNNNINSINESHNVNKGLLLMFFSIVLIASGYIMMVSGIFDKVKKVETKIDNKIVYTGKDEVVKIKVNTNNEFEPVVKFRSKNGKFTVSSDIQQGKEVETKIIAKESGEDALIVEVGREENKKEKVEEVKVLICEEPKLLNTTDKTLSMKEDTSLQLKFNVDDKCLEGYKIYVEDSSVADIDDNYVLIANVSGRTTLVLDGGDTIKYTLNVKPTKVNVTGVKINTKAFNLAIGKTKNLSVTVKPSDATNKKVTYESSNPGVATVTSGGKVKGISTGVAIITVTTEENSKTDTVIVKVYKSTNPVSTTKVTSIKFNKTSETMYVGESKSLVTTISPSNATNKKITCKSSNDSIVKVSVSNNSCLVKGVAVGTATITVITKDGNKKATASVKVDNNPSTTISATGIKFDKASESVYVGESISLTTTISPSNATNKTITCTSGDTSVATVSVNGNACIVKGVKEGTAKITVKTSDGNKTSTIDVKVSKKPATKVKVTGIKFDKTSGSIYVGESTNLTTTISPSNATNKAITCTSSNTSVATVSVNGNACVVKGVKEGTAKITAKTSDGNKTSTIDVKVTKKPDPVVSVTSIKFDKTSAGMYVGENISLATTISPSNATNKKITCTSSNTSIATVSVNGNACVVKGVKEGSVKITAKTADGNKTSTIDVKVTKKPDPVVSVTSIKFEKENYNVALNQTIVAVVGITPTNATNKAITCKSLNTGIVTVKYSGNKCTITGVKVGTATIEAYSADGNKKATTTITVDPIKITGLKFEKDNYTVAVNAQVTANVNITPSSATNKKITCTSDSTKIAAVSVNGNVCVIKGLAAGTAKITAKAQDGSGLSATTKVTVSQSQSTIEYTLKFDLNDGKGTKPNNLTMKYDSNLPKLSTPTPQYDGYVFLGWYNNKDFKKGKQYYNANGEGINKYDVKSDMTLYAGWIPQDTFIVKYDCNGGKGTPPADQYIKNGDKFVPAVNKNCTTMIKGSQKYVFDGWYDANGKDWTINPVSKMTFKNGTNGVQNNIFVLKAAWDKELGTTNAKSFQRPTSIIDYNGKKSTITYAGACDDSKISGKTDAMEMNSHSYCSFESETLKYYIIKGKGSDYLVTHIWVENAYKQLKVAIAERDPNPPKEKKDDNLGNSINNILKESLGRDIITHEINTYGYANKGLVGINASAMIGQNWATSAHKGWRGGPQVDIFRNKGTTIRSAGTWFSAKIQYGLTKDGHLKAYYDSNSTSDSNVIGNKKDLIKDYIENVDKVQDVFGFVPVLVKKGKSQKGINTTLSWTDHAHARQAICQIDKNRFILISSIRNPDKKNSDSRGLSLEEMANMMVLYGCYTGFNLDGGGSTSYFYKGKTNNLVGPFHAHDGRISGDILYFVEK